MITGNKQNKIMACLRLLNIKQKNEMQKKKSVNIFQAAEKFF
jgi:hypothetical protein